MRLTSSILKIQSSNGIGAEYLAPFLIGQTAQCLYLSDRFEVTHRHRIIRPDDHAVRADDFDQILQCGYGVKKGIEIDLFKVLGGPLGDMLSKFASLVIGMVEAPDLARDKVKRFFYPEDTYPVRC